MHRSATINIQAAMFMTQLEATGEGAPTPEEKQRMLTEIRGHSPEVASQVELKLLKTVEKMASGLMEADENQHKLRALLEKMAAPPWHPAVLLGVHENGSEPTAMVMHGSTRRVVSIGDEIDTASLKVGAEVLLGSNLNVVVSISPYARISTGHTAIFDRYTQDGRLVLKSRDEEIVIHPGEELCQIDLKNGDAVRFDGTEGIAYERIERSRGERFFLEDTPQESFADIGGLESKIFEIQKSIQLHSNHPDTARRYRLKRKKAILLSGPPGTGKTLMAKALANWLAQRSRSGKSRFMHIKPAALHSIYYSQSEANYREVFKVARMAAERDPNSGVVMFFDEVDAVAARRGGRFNRIDDRVLNAFLDELDGLEDRGNLVIVSATNRADILDPAANRPGRLADLRLVIPRPNRIAARDIFCKHFYSDIPYASNGQGSDFARDMLINSAVSQIYSPNGESKLATITFRDGKHRDIYARDLINGAEIAKIAQAAIERACLRETQNGSSGVRLEDVLVGVDDFFETATKALTPANCHGYLDDLPQDMDVVRVDRFRRKVRQPGKYLNSSH